MLHSPTRCCLRPTCQVPTPMNFEGSSILGTGAAFGNKYSSEEMVGAFHKQRALEGDTTWV